MCFVSLQETCDSVDRELLQKVLARAGVSDGMITVNCQSHDVVLARVRMGDGTFGLVCTAITAIQHLLDSGTQSSTGAAQQGGHR